MALAYISHSIRASKDEIRIQVDIRQIKNVRYEAVEIVGDSMQSTLLDGQVTYYDKKASPVRGDVIIIEGENADIPKQVIVKRYVAGAGDTVKIFDG